VAEAGPDLTRSGGTSLAVFGQVEGELSELLGWLVPALNDARSELRDRVGEELCRINEAPSVAQVQPPAVLSA
jgi:hypothetical protein